MIIALTPSESILAFPKKGNYFDPEGQNLGWPSKFGDQTLGIHLGRRARIRIGLQIWISSFLALQFGELESGFGLQILRPNLLVLQMFSHCKAHNFVFRPTTLQIVCDGAKKALILVGSQIGG
jgi:hypothetical protein